MPAASPSANLTPTPDPGPQPFFREARLVTILHDLRSPLTCLISQWTLPDRGCPLLGPDGAYQVPVETLWARRL